MENPQQSCTTRNLEGNKNRNSEVSKKLKSSDFNKLCLYGICLQPSIDNSFSEKSPLNFFISLSNLLYPRRPLEIKLEPYNNQENFIFYYEEPEYFEDFSNNFDSIEYFENLKQRYLNNLRRDKPNEYQVLSLQVKIFAVFYKPFYLLNRPQNEPMKIKIKKIYQTGGNRIFTEKFYLKENTYQGPNPRELWYRERHERPFLSKGSAKGCHYKVKHEDSAKQIIISSPRSKISLNKEGYWGLIKIENKDLSNAVLFGGGFKNEAYHEKYHKKYYENHLICIPPNIFDNYCTVVSNNNFYNAKTLLLTDLISNNSQAGGSKVNSKSSKKVYGTMKNGSNVYKNKLGFYTVKQNKRTKKMYKKYLNNWNPKKTNKRK